MFLRFILCKFRQIITAYGDDGPGYNLTVRFSKTFPRFVNVIETSKCSMLNGLRYRKR